ncbi:HNH endonuclease [Ruminococcaceae bacterium YRB3002]|nr:HNH endonuclease [Ruminococcaceae bacterium YRB3002]
MNEAELAIILGFYYIGREKNAERFTQLFNSCFGKDLSMQTLLHEVSVFRNVDPKYNVMHSSKNNIYYKIWKEYIENDDAIELKKLYKVFWSGDFIKHDPSPDVQSSTTDDAYDIVIIDKPKLLQSIITVQNEKHKRDSRIANNALAIAGFICEGRCSNELFLKKDGVNKYTEAHHLIPLKYQKYFEYDLDVEANIVSLCPMCHRLLHYGFDNKSLLKTLYEQRAYRLEKCGIGISFEKLLLLYASGDISDE